MSVVLLKGKNKFLQVSNWAYLKTPQLGATEACVFDLLRRTMEQSCRATTQAFILSMGIQDYYCSYLHKKIPICIGLLL